MQASFTRNKRIILSILINTIFIRCTPLTQSICFQNATRFTHPINIKIIEKDKTERKADLICTVLVDFVVERFNKSKTFSMYFALNTIRIN